jgi:hypothetical protein
MIEKHSVSSSFHWKTAESHLHSPHSLQCPPQELNINAAPLALQETLKTFPPVAPFPLP